jgi:hypothetical protein
MKCGCSPQGVISGTNKPVCIVHDCTEVATPPDLTGRMAYCAYGKHAQVPSSTDLPFFEYLGPGSPESLEHCTCGYYQSAHNSPKITTVKCTNFTPKGPAEFDRYYCGCRGWD